MEQEKTLEQQGGEKTLQSLRDDAHDALQRCYDLAESLLQDWGEDKEEDTPPHTPERRRRKKKSLSLRRLSEIDLEDLRDIHTQMKHRLRNVSKEETDEEEEEESFSRDAARKRASDFAKLMKTEIQCVESIVNSRTGKDDENYKNAMKESKKATEILEHLLDRQSFEMRRMQTQLEESRNKRVADQSKFVRMIRNANIVTMKSCEKEMDSMVEEIEEKNREIDEVKREEHSIRTRFEIAERDARESFEQKVEGTKKEVELESEVVVVLRKKYQKDRDAFRMRLRTLEKAKNVESERLKKMQYEELRERSNSEQALNQERERSTSLQATILELEEREKENVAEEERWIEDLTNLRETYDRQALELEAEIESSKRELRDETKRSETRYEFVPEEMRTEISSLRELANREQEILKSRAENIGDQSERVKEELEVEMKRERENEESRIRDLKRDFKEQEETLRSENAHLTKMSKADMNSANERYNTLVALYTEGEIERAAIESAFTSKLKEQFEMRREMKSRWEQEDRERRENEERILVDMRHQLEEWEKSSSQREEYYEMFEHNAKDQIQSLKETQESETSMVRGVRARSARISIMSLTSTLTSLSKVLEYQFTRITLVLISYSLSIK